MQAQPLLPDPTPRIYAGLFVVAFATLMFEILLTRIFSVTLWYHFAFFAISVAMFGLTAGALLVYLRPAWFPLERTEPAMAWSAAGFGVAAALAVIAHVALPTSTPWRLSITYLLALVPFTLVGICICLALTRYPRATNRLYAADLAGAALGCAGVIGLLNVLDGMSAVLITAAVALVSALVLAPPAERRLRLGAAALIAVASVTATLNNHALRRQQPLLPIQWVKVGKETPPLYERWNAFSRITVHADAPDTPVGWGLSPLMPFEGKVDQAWLRIDGFAGTLLTRFDGDLRKVDYLRYDISNLAHHLRPRARTLVLGAGGGRDVLAALVFGSPGVVAVEMNGVTLDTVNRRYGAYTGNLDRVSGVRFVRDEARSWTARSREQFDIIQASWIDTFAATASGALALTENSLYTLEAWNLFLDRLSPGGVLTFTRSFTPQDQREAARLAALARATLLARGVADPERHIFLAVNENRRSWESVAGNATLLVSASPFSREDVTRMVQVCTSMGFSLVLSPGGEDRSHPLIRAAASGKGLADWPYRLDAPTDDRPFFFNLLSLYKLGDPAVGRTTDAHASVASNLVILAVTVVALLALCIGAPLALVRRADETRPGWQLVAFFALIGLGFMAVEIGLLQRLALFLGHPIYAISVVLAAILVFSGCGSFLSAAVAARGPHAPALVIAALGILVGLAALLVPAMAAAAQSAPTAARIALSLAALAPLGLLMGMAFPFGAARAHATHASTALPWLWGVNGAASVLGSVLAAMVAIEHGISANLWLGAACYLLAAAARLSERTAVHAANQVA